MRAVTLQRPGGRTLEGPVAHTLRHRRASRRLEARWHLVVPAGTARPPIPDPPPAWRAALQALSACLVAAVVGGFVVGTAFTYVVTLVLEHLAA